MSGQFSLANMNDASTTQAVDSAIADGSKWVLKPQREGGGNNLYGNELSEFLSKHRNDPILGGKQLPESSSTLSPFYAILKDIF